MLEEMLVDCPYCGEAFDTLVDSFRRQPALHRGLPGLLQAHRARHRDGRGRQPEYPVGQARRRLTTAANRHSVLPGRGMGTSL